MTYRVIAKLDIKGPNVIKGLQFDGHRVLGTAEELAETLYGEGIDELIYIDTVASLYRRNSLLDIISRAATRIFLPLTVAGGLRSIDDVRVVLRAGADKVAINTAATADPSLLQNAARIFGAQCIVSQIDAYRSENGEYRVWVDYGREPTAIDALAWARRVEELGAGEILLTSINRDGMGTGFDLELVRVVASAVSIPVIACGGAGRKEDFAEVITQGRADAVAAASVFHYHYGLSQVSRLLTAQKRALRMGQAIDHGNVEFLLSGYGGQQEFPVTPLRVRDVKQHLRDCDLPVRAATAAKTRKRASRASAR